MISVTRVYQNRKYNLQKLKAQAEDHLIRKCVEEYDEETVDLADAFCLVSN